MKCDAELPEVVLTGVDHVEVSTAPAVDHMRQFQSLQLHGLTCVLATQQKRKHAQRAVGKLWKCCEAL